MPSGKQSLECWKGHINNPQCKPVEAARSGGSEKETLCRWTQVKCVSRTEFSCPSTPTAAWRGHCVERLWPSIWRSELFSFDNAPIRSSGSGHTLSEVCATGHDSLSFTHLSHIASLRATLREQSILVSRQGLLSGLANMAP